MADLQLLEFISEWEIFWGNVAPIFQPIGTLPIVGASLHNIHPQYLATATLKDWVEVFAADDGVDIGNTLDTISNAAAQNQASFKRGQMTREILTRLDRQHVAVQLARLESNGDARAAMRRGNQILTQQPIGTQIEFFVDFGGMNNLKSYQVESALATDLWSSKAKLRSRYIDRHHAAVALPYCDSFVTDDGDLTRRCEAAKMSLKFATAKVQKAEDFIRSL